MKRRSEEVELMDLGPSHYTLEEYREALSFLGKIGRALGGDRASLSSLRKLTPSPRAILDVGCVGGYFTARLAKKYPDARVVGMDIDQEAIRYARTVHKGIP